MKTSRPILCALIYMFFVFSISSVFAYGIKWNTANVELDRLIRIDNKIIEDLKTVVPCDTDIDCQIKNPHLGVY